MQRSSGGRHQVCTGGLGGHALRHSPHYPFETYEPRESVLTMGMLLVASETRVGGRQYKL